MKLFLDIILCVIMVMLLIGVLDQIVKLTKENLSTVSVATAFAGGVDINRTYQHRLVIVVVETVLLVLLRWVVLKL